MTKTINRNIRINRNTYNRLAILVAIEKAETGIPVSIGGKIGELVEKYIEQQDPEGKISGL